jgi:hypothetical protein
VRLARDNKEALSTGYWEALDRLPLRSCTLKEFWGRYPLDFLKTVDQVIYDNYRKSLEKAQLSLEKHAFDNRGIKTLLLKSVHSPNDLQARSNLESWDELFILFIRPFLYASDRIVDTFEQGYINHLGPETGFIVPMSGVTLQTSILVGFTLSPSQLDLLDEMLLLAMGPIAFYRRRIRESKNGRRISAGKSRNVLITGLVIKSLERIS